jgi:hypothetical protein
MGAQRRVHFPSFSVNNSRLRIQRNTYLPINFVSLDRWHSRIYVVLDTMSMAAIHSPTSPSLQPISNFHDPIHTPEIMYQIICCKLIHPQNHFFRP